MSSLRRNYNLLVKRQNIRIDMINYFKYQWEAMERQDKENSDEEDVVLNFEWILEWHLGILEECVKNSSKKNKEIVVGWNADEVDVMVVQSYNQAMLCLVEIIQTKNLANHRAWIFMGDFNVTLKLEEHSNRSSNMSIDMNEFRDDVNNVEFEKAHGIFLPYLLSDHSPAIMTILKGIIKKKKSFTFANYVADKDDFCGYKVKVVQKLKLLKKLLNQLNWQNGNLFERANALKEKLKDAQSKVDVDPFNLENRKNVVNLVNEYTIVAEDELKLLQQKAKVKWLKEGGRNSSYFHNILKERKHKSTIESICCEDSRRVADMIKDVSDKEIKEELFDIDSSKAAGPDRYTSSLVPKIDTPNKNPGGFAKGKARVAWKIVCRPKEQGGLGFKPLHKWNEFIRHKDIYDARVSINDCLADAICNGRWKWIDEWNSSPQQAIILWMEIQKKLLTQDRMVWIQGGNLKCSLCKVCADSHDHLFFECHFSKKVWERIKSKGKQLMYHVWMKRNKRTFQSLFRSEEELYEVILGNTANMLKCLRVKKSKEVLNMANQWNLNWEKERLINVIVDKGADMLERSLQWLEPCILEFSSARAPFAPNRWIRLALGGSSLLLWIKLNFCIGRCTISSNLPLLLEDRKGIHEGVCFWPSDANIIVAESNSNDVDAVCVW
ncbi:RNA-directed DNA polymerase, eukaryota, reverse transcriptase zinc-binding domain protein [Tanacetum coccineum]